MIAKIFGYLTLAAIVALLLYVRHKFWYFGPRPKEVQTLFGDEDSK